MSQPELILASGSPRRRQLLTDAGYCFRVVTAREGVEEQAERHATGVPGELVTDLARAKGQDVVQQLQDPCDTLVLAADTVAACDEEILGKPTDAEDARRMMNCLSGREHQVHTGLFLAHLRCEEPPQIELHTVCTNLQMDSLTPEWIENYVLSGKWRGKAGGFGYQDGLGFVHVTQGSSTNVVGLPMELVKERLAHYGG